MPSIVIAQGGGPTAVINQTLCGAILAARRHDPSVRILGARYGVRGLTAPRGWWSGRRRSPEGIVSSNIFFERRGRGSSF